MDASMSSLYSRDNDYDGPVAVRATTIGTVVVRSGPIQMVIALLQSPDKTYIKVVELEPRLTTLGENIEEAVSLQKQHDETLRKVQNLPTPLDEFAHKADKLLTSKRISPDLITAMADTLHIVWDDILKLLHDRKHLLDLCANFHEKMGSCRGKMSSLEVACKDTMIPIEVEAVQDFLNKFKQLRIDVLTTVMAALKDGNELLTQLQELTKQQTLDTRPDHIKRDALRAINQVQQWLEALHDQRNALDQAWQTRKTQLEQCLALAILAKDLDDVESILAKKRNELSGAFSVGECEHTANTKLQQYHELKHNAILLRDRALKITCAEEKLVSSGCFAGDEARSRAYNILSGCTEYLDAVEQREHWLMQSKDFFGKAEKTLAVLEKLEIELSTSKFPTNTPESFAMFSKILRDVRGFTEDPLRLGYGLLDEIGRTKPETQGVKRVIEEIENRKVYIESICSTSTEEQVRVEQALNNFLEQYNQLLAWLVTSAQSFLQKSVSLGRNLQESRRFLLHHHELMQHLEDKGELINSLLETIKSHLESLSPQQRYDVDSKAEALHKHWIELKDIVLKRVDVVSLLIEFFEKAEHLDDQYNSLEQGLEQVSDEKKLRFMQDSWSTIQKEFNDLKQLAERLINLKIVDPYLETNSLRSDIEDIINSFSSRQIDVTTSLENITTKIAEKREIEIILEKIMNDNNETANKTTKVDTELYPVFTSPSENAEFLHHETKQKLTAVVNDIEQAQDEIEQRVQTTLSIQTKDQESLQKIDQVITNLRTLKSKLDGIKYDYRTLLESILNFVENVIQLRQQIDEYFVVQKSKFPDNSCEKIDRIITDHERFRENCMDKFRSLITQSELLIDRVRVLEPLGAREVDTDRILKLLENLRIHFESRNGARMSDLDRLEKLESFRSDLYDINRSLDSVSKQLSDINGQSIDSLASAKTTSLAFEYFERTIELLEKRITNFTENSQSLYATNPDSEQFVRDELRKLEDKWKNFKEQVKSKRNSLNSATDFFEIVEKIDAEYREISYFYTSVSNKVTYLRDPVEASNLVNDIETYIGTREGRLRDSLEKAHQCGHDARKATTLQNDVFTLLQSFVKLKTDISIVQERMKVEERLREQQAQAAKDQAERERLAREQAERERLAREQAERERLAREQAENDRLAREHAERERFAREQAEREKLAREHLEREKIAWEQAERERLGREYAEKDRIARENAEKERQAWEQAERERFAREQAERDRLAREQAEREFLERERLAREKAQAEFMERELLANQQAERERLAREQAEREFAERERLAREQAERERLAREQAEKDFLERERLAREQAERDRLAREQAERVFIERERMAREQAEKERQAREQLEKDFVERERLARERVEKERIAREKEEKDRIIREQTEIITIIKDNGNNDQVAHSDNIEDIRKELKINEMFTEIKYSQPRFTKLLKDAVTKEGDRFLFECQVVGSPTPTVEWYKDGILIHNNPDYKTSLNSDGVCTLLIEETFVADSARFSCRASNLVGVSDTSATLSVRENPAEVQMTPPEIVKFLEIGKATEGSPFEFTCIVTGNPLPTVQWYKQDKCIDDSPDYLISYNNGEAKLKFEEVFLEDDAIYTCSASNQVGIKHCSARLIVEPLEPTEIPHFKIPLNNVMARVGQKIRLEALVGGIPRPDIYWTHNGKPYASREMRYEYGRVTLMIPEAYPKDSGEYVLTAKNLAGEAFSTCNVMVKGRLPNETSDSEMASDMEPIKPSVQLPLKDVSIFEGKSVRLDCVIVGQPEPEVIWYHDERPVKESADVQLLFQGDRCSLLIQEVYQEDAGHYKVVAINSAGEASSSCELKVTPLNIAEPATRNHSENVTVATDKQPKFEKFLSDVLVAEGDPVEMECIAVGDQPLQAKWYLSNKELEETSDRIKIIADSEKGIFKLVFSSVSVDDKGVYTVKVSNKSGDAKCFSHLIVKSVNAAPDIQRVQQIEIEEKLVCPTFTELFSDKNGLPGEVIKFECIVKGKPTPKIRWFFNDQPVHGKNFLISTSGERQVLTIPEASPETVGKICCIAENETGKATCIAFFNLIGSGHQPSSVANMQQSTQEHNTGSSSVTIKKQTFTTTSTSQVNSYEGNLPQMEVHTSSAHIDQSLKQLNNQRPEVVESHHYQEIHKTNDLPAAIQQKSIVSIQSASDLSPKSTRKQIAPRFTTPLVGKIVDQGADVFLEVIYDGFPSPEIKIHKNGAELFENDKTKITNKFNRLTIDLKQVGVLDAGRYSVTASNTMGQSTSTADVVVKKTIFPPVFGHRLQAQVAKRGERIVMEVEVTGTPDPTVTWLKDDKPLKEVGLSEHRIKSMGNTHTLIIEKGQTTDSGKFMVKATNAGGEAKSIADCVIVEPTPERMIEVVKTVIFDDAKDIIAEPFKQEPPGFQTNHSTTTTESDLHGTSESKIITEHRCTTAATMRLEHKSSYLDLPVLQRPTTSQASETQPIMPDLKNISANFQPSQTVTDSFQTAPQVATKPTPIMENGQTESSSVSKKSSLEYFKKIEIQHQQQQQYQPMKAQSSERYQKFEDLSKPTGPQFSTIKPGAPPLEMDFNLVPGSPPEMCYIPKVEYQKPQLADKIKKIEQSQAQQILKEPPMGGVQVLPQMSPILEETSRSSSFVKETKIEYGQPIIRTAANLPTPARPFTRSPSPKPSAEGLRMEKLWTPTPTQNGGYESYQSDYEHSSYKSEPECEVPKTIVQTKQIFEEKIKEHETRELSAPNLVKQVTSVPIPVVVAPKPDPLPDINLVPGSPPEICFAPQPEQRRQSLVEAMEKTLENDLLRGPSKVLPHSVPTFIPQAQPTTKAPPPPVFSKPMQFDVPKIVKPPPPVLPPKLVRLEASESEYESDRWKYSGSESDESCFKPVKTPQVVGTRPKSMEVPPVPLKVSGYTADTEELSSRKFESVFESRQFFESKQQSSTQQYQNGFAPSPIREEKDFNKSSIVSNITYNIPPKPQAPPAVSPSKFNKGDISDYSSEVDERFRSVSRTYESDSEIKGYRVVHPPTPTLSGRRSNISNGHKSPLPPMEFEHPPPMQGPTRPKFEPIKQEHYQKTQTQSQTQQQKVFKPKPVAAKFIEATQAAATPKTTMYYTAVSGAPMHLAKVATETKNSMQMKESTETCQRIVNMQQTKRVIHFDSNEQKQRSETPLEPFPYTVTSPNRLTPARQSVPPPGTPTRFVPGDFRESDYESEVEGARIRPVWTPNPIEGEPRYRHVEPPHLGAGGRCTSLPRTYERVLSPMEFDRGPEMPSKIHIDTQSRKQNTQTLDRYSSSLSSSKKTYQRHVTKTTRDDMNLEVGSPPKYSYIQNQANTQANDMGTTFLQKHHKFVNEITSDLKSAPTQHIRPGFKRAPSEGTTNKPEAYRNESRVSQYGTKCVDPNTGLIYFKYDFGYEFGILFPGEGKKFIGGGKSYSSSSNSNSNSNNMPRKPISNSMQNLAGEIVIPIQHEHTMPTAIRTRTTTPTYQYPNAYGSQKRRTSLPTIEINIDRIHENDSALPNLRTVSDQSSDVPVNSHLLRQNQTKKPPVFITPLKDIAAVTGKTARFECIVQSDPNTAIAWFKNGFELDCSNKHVIEYRNGVCRLTIPQTYPDDAGIYSCSAANLLGTATTQAQLVVSNNNRGSRI